VGGAENDVKAITAALQQLKIPVTTLLNSQATKSKIESKIRTTIASLTPADTLYVFYAGHGFADGGQNYLTGWDYDFSDPTGTSVQLKYLYDQIQDRDCNGVLFIDACHSGMRLSFAARDLTPRFSEQELRVMFAKAKHCSVFSACKDNESSWSSNKLGHGIWTYHVVQALTGGANKAYDSDRYLTGESLQQYLSSEVPKVVQAEHKEVQTPWFAGAQSTTFLIADRQDMLAAKQVLVSPDITDIEFFSTESERISRLSGFIKRAHFEPTKHSQDAVEFIQRCASDDIEADVENYRQRIGKSALFKWADIKTECVESGFTTTPKFHYTITIDQDTDDPGNAEWTRCLTQLSDLSLLSNPKFNQIFQNTFDRVEVSYNKAVVKDIIEIVESKNLQTEFKLYVPSNFAWCQISVPKHGTLVIRSKHLEFHSSGSPEELLNGLFETLTKLRDEYHLVIHPFTLSRTDPLKQP
jgi:uncharacterized caspase-like protein